MREKIYNILKKTYGILMTISFFAGGIPIFPFVIALIIGGKAGEAICLFLYQEYYPWVILVGSISIVIGVVAMYIGKLEGLSVKKISANDKENK